MILWLAVHTYYKGYAFPITEIDNHGFWIEVPSVYDYGNSKGFFKVDKYYFEFENISLLNDYPNDTK